MDVKVIFDLIKHFRFKKMLHQKNIVYLVFIAPFFFTISAHAQDAFEPYVIGMEAPIELLPVKGNTINMGGDEVEVDSFWMGKYEITWEQYKQFSTEMMSNLTNQKLPGTDIGVDADAISLPSPPYVDMSFGMGTDGFPAISMTHYAASMFTKWLTVKTGDFYRLPTEAEWEYACRSGKVSNEKSLDSQAWHQENSGRGYQKVGTKMPNEIGIYDMPGNVAEWTTDQYHEDYYERIREIGNEPILNPWFQPTDLYPRAVRGASWMDKKSEVSCQKRRASKSDWKRLDPQMPKSLWWHTSAHFLGFRVVRPFNQPPKHEMKKYWPEPIEDYE